MNRYSIVINPEMFGAVVEHLKSLGGSNIRYAPASKQVFVTLSPYMVEELQGEGFVVTQVHNVYPSIVEVPRHIFAPGEFSPYDMLDLLGFNRFKLSVDPPLSGEGFNVAVIDTGIRPTHQLLGGKVIYSKNFTGSPPGDGFDHGTGVASIIHAMAPDAGILDMKVLDDAGQGTEENLVLALEECISLLDTEPEIAPNIVNMSLGSFDDGNIHNPVRVACRAAIERGLVLVASAGNSGPDPVTITVPACEQYVVSVGSMKYPDLRISNFSSRGPTQEGLTKPDTVFMGENIIMASSTSDVATVSKSGTSFAAPFATGVILLTKEGVIRTHTIPDHMFVGKNVITSVIAVDNMLPSVCTKPEDAPAEKDNHFGYGIPLGSLVQSRTTAHGFIDIPGTIAMSMLVMMMLAMADVSDTMFQPAKRRP